MSKNVTTIAGVLVGTLLTTPTMVGVDVPIGRLSVRTIVQECGRLPAASAGEDRVVLVGEEVAFQGVGSSPEAEIVEYAWDFESDGTPDFVAAGTGFTTHTFAAEGDYRCLLTVRDSRGQTARDSRHLIVVARQVDATTAQQMLNPRKPLQTNPPDGVQHRYAILINGGGETRFWTDVELAYDMLVNGYGFEASDVYLLNYAGTDPQGGNPGAMIDAAARIQDVQSAFATVANRSDQDDEVFVWITDHGRGYDGPLSQGGRYLGYLDGRASVDPGDEADFLESNFKLRGLTTGGDYYPHCNHGLNAWMCDKRYYSATKTLFWRQEFVSQLDSIYIHSAGAVVSDNDVYIEQLADYAAGDTNRDGYIDTGQGEVFDYDGDGIPPYDPNTGAFDVGDWGEIDAWTDDWNYLNTQMPVNAYPYRVFDAGFEGRLCIDLGYAGGTLHVDGRDDDNAGLFDWMDVNQDGDLDDVVSIDEAVCLYSGDLYDDDLAALVDQMSVAKLTVAAEPCFSGGLVEDLTSPTRVICTATIEDAVSWGNLYIRSFVAALHGQDEYGMLVDADADANGYVSMLEAFNYASGHDYYDEIPQYDDNGDGLSHTDPVPAGGDGPLGSSTYLADPGARLATPAFAPGGGTYDSTVVVTISCADPGVIIRYTIDNSEPTPSSASYSVPLHVDHRLVLKARAYCSGSLPSAVEQAAYFLPGNRIVHVSPDGSDANDGLTWATAKRTVGAALGTAVAGDDVWVQGRTSVPYHERVSLPLDVALYGGFLGTETRLSQRGGFPRAPDDPNTSILDGDQAGTVVLCPTDASAITLLDGLTIRNGRAANGGGIRVDSGSPTLRNCTITANTADSSGGGIFCGDYVRTTIENCVIAANHAQDGGGIDAWNSNASIVNCTIAGNSAVAFGGGLYFYSYTLGEDSRPRFVDCAIIGNSAGQWGGATYFQGGAPELINCTVNANSTNYTGGGFLCYGSTLTIANCVLWGDHALYYGHELDLRGSSNVTLSYSDMSGGLPGASIEAGSTLVWGDGCIDSDPVFVDPDGRDGDVATWEDNDYRLLSGSPCIDAGDNDAVPGGISSDLHGHSRFADDPGTDPDPGHGIPPIVDMGAYEHQVPSAVGEDALALGTPRLLGNRPNPFAAATTVRYFLPAPCPVKLCIYDVGGRLVRVLVDVPSHAAGMHFATWNARTQGGKAVGSGIYLYRLDAGRFSATKKMTILR